jgi:uncharacterized protein YegL
MKSPGQFSLENQSSTPEGLIHQAKKEEKKPPTEEQVQAHNEALTFVEQNRDLFEHYARGRVHYKAAPPGLDTFAYNLVTDDILISPRFYTDKGLSEEATSFATLHETEHLLEKKQLVSEKGGERMLSDYLKKKEKSEAFSVMDNCIADIRQNRAVVSKTHQGFEEIEQRCYKESLFKETDFTDQPEHIQLPQALLREARVPDEQCTVSPEVRAKIDELKAIKGADGSSLLDVMTNPNTPMSARLKMQDKYIWPMVQDLLKKDMEDKKDKPKDGEGNGDGNDGKEGQGKPGEGDAKGDSKPQNGKKEGGKQKSKEAKGDAKGAKQSKDPNEVFADAYKKAQEKTMNAVPIKEEKKALEEYKTESKTGALERADKEYADKLGVSKEALQNYRQIVASLESIVNPETGATAIQELRDMINRIIADRMKPAPAPRYPIEEGEDLVDPVGLVAEAKAGNFEPKVWETYETKEKKGKKFGEVEITLVCDRSGSMDGEKLNEQQRSAVLMMEALKEFSDQSDEERVNMEKPLEIRSEVYSFQSDEGRRDSVPLKKLSKELEEKERIEVAAALSTTSGTTTDFVPLEAIEKSVTPEHAQKIKDGEVKKIVIVFTDGGSDDVPRVEKVLGKLRAKGIIAIGVGITEAGRPALTTYAPNARLAETAGKLPMILTDLLKEHLRDI